MITFNPEALQAISWSVYNTVANVNAPLIVDRKAMPLLSYMMKREESTGLAGADGVTIKYKTQSNLDIQGWELKDILQFGTQNLELDAKYGWSNIHQGYEIVHDEIEAKGFIILPNQSRGKAYARPDSESDSFRLVNYVKESIESMLDKYKVNVDLLMHQDNSANPKLPQGIDAYWPIGATPGMVTDAGGTRGYYSSGSIGGRLRAAYPDQLQHYVWFNATYGANGTLRDALQTAKREAQLRSRGRTKSGIKFIMAGAGAMDRYRMFGTKNDTNLVNAVTVLNNGGLSRLDIGIPDSAIHFEGIPVIHNPTFEILDALYPGLSVPWTRRMYLIDDESMCISYAPGKKEYFSAPADEHNVRVSRMSLDSKMVLLPKVVNANAVIGLAA